MARSLAGLMQSGHAHSRRASTGAGASRYAGLRWDLEAREPRYDALVQMLRDRAADDRAAREKRQRGYRQSLDGDTGVASTDVEPRPPARLQRFRTKVPCRITPAARALLERLAGEFPGSSVTFSHGASGQQVLMLTGGALSEPRRIGWVEQCAESDSRLCNVRHEGLLAETDDGTTLVLRFRYPRTSTKVSAGRSADVRGAASEAGDASDTTPCVDFAELRPALNVRQLERGSSPRLVWVTRPELETMSALGDRDYDAFYTRFKLEIAAGIWHSLSASLATSPASQWHRGSYYTVLREPDTTNGRIHQRTVDDSDRAVDIGLDRIYDAAPATDILLLHLDGDTLADLADIYFTLQSLRATDAFALKEQFFTIIRRFWAASRSLAWRYGSDVPAVVRMSQRASPLPYQAPLLTQDWMKLRESLVDRYGRRGRKAPDLVGNHTYRPRVGPAAWPFASFPAGDVNIGLRVVYRQQWRNLGTCRGEVIRSVPAVGAGAKATNDPTRCTSRSAAAELQGVETSFEQGEPTRALDDIVAAALDGTIKAMHWPLDRDGCVNTGARDLAATSDMGLDSECRESSRDMSVRLTEIMKSVAARTCDQPAAAAASDAAEGADAPAIEEDSSDDDAATYTYSRLQRRYELLTQPAEMQNVVLVAERLPSPADIDRSWVRRHGWIIAQALLDESLRGTLEAIADDGTKLEAERDRLYDHVRANILHYQRAIWWREDPQQRSMRYRKSGRKVPLDWRFEMPSGEALTIGELGARLSRQTIDGQFAAYASGREADLDQVIDPTGPVGYYGNYAVYHMRPELGGDDAFSMLHFFKSPYLRPNPRTGEPEVEDPVQIQIGEDPAVTSASDDVIEQHRSAIVEHVPGSTAPRRDFATYLFRRERARRLVLETGGVIVDVVRSVAIALPRDDAALHVVRLPDGYRVIGAGAPGLELLAANADSRLESTWTIGRSGAGHSLALLAGRTPHADAGRSIFADSDGRPGLTAFAGGDAAERRDPLIFSQGDAEPAAVLHPGRPHVPDAERVIIVQDERAFALGAMIGKPPAQSDDRMIVDVAGGERTTGLSAGAGAGRAHDLVILARHNGWLRPSLIAEARKLQA